MRVNSRKNILILRDDRPTHDLTPFWEWSRYFRLEIRKCILMLGQQIVRMRSFKQLEDRFSTTVNFTPISCAYTFLLIIIFEKIVITISG